MVQVYISVVLQKNELKQVFFHMVYRNKSLELHLRFGTTDATYVDIRNASVQFKKRSVLRYFINTATQNCVIELYHVDNCLNMTFLK